MDAHASEIGSDDVSVAGFQLVRCQLVIFTPDEEVSGAKIIRELLTRPNWSRHFDAEPIVLPSAPGVPRELPKVILRSADQAWRCDVSSETVAITWEPPETEPSTQLSTIVGQITPFLNEYRDALRARVARLAAVVSRFHRHPSPGNYLARHFCKPEWLIAPFNRPESFELHAHKRYAFSSDISVNSWVRNKTAVLAQRATPIILVEQDLNTPVEDASERNFAVHDIDNFFRRVISELDTILYLYYPAGQHA